MSLQEQLRGFDLTALKAAQVKVFEALLEKRYSFGSIASILGLSSGPHVRNFMVSRARPRADNEVLQAVHQSIHSRPAFYAEIIGKSELQEYLRNFPAADSSESQKILYQRKVDDRFSSENAAAISEIFHDIYGRDNSAEVDSMRHIEGRYCAIRVSSKGETVVKSLLSIRRGEVDVGGEPSSYMRFRHEHPTKFYNPLYFAKPRITDGVVIKVGNTLHLLGNTGNGASATFFFLKLTRASNLAFIPGFHVTTEPDDVIINARCVLIRIGAEEEPRIGRFKMSEIEDDKELFFISMMRRSDIWMSDRSDLIEPT